MGMAARIVLASLAALAAPVLADISVVVNRNSEVQQLSPEEVSSLYLGRGRIAGKFPRFLILERPRDSDIRRRFFRRLNGMELAHVDRIWARLQFSGEAFPPTPVQDDRRVLESLRFYRDAIGYVESGSIDSTVREVLRIKE